MRPTPIAPWVAARAGIATERLTRADLERYQLDRLRETIRYARQRSRFYDRHLAGSRCRLTTLDNLAGLPFTTAADLRERGTRFLCVSQDEIARVVTLDTSGTTGAPKRLYFTEADQESTVEFFRVGMSTFTEPGDTVMILLPVERPGSVGDLLATALEALDARPVRHGVVRDVPATLDVMRRERVTGLVGIPTQVLALARQAGPGRRGGGLRLVSALLSTDHVPHAVARAVEHAWGCQVYNHYGMTEMGLGGAVECRARCGYHLREVDLYFEIVDPVTGAPVPEGELGEIVFTTLTRRGAPLIRYRTGDLSRFMPGGCPCGAPLRRLERVETRVDGRVPIGRGGRLTMAELDEALFSVEPVVDFSAVVSGIPEPDCLRIEVRVIDGAGSRVAAAIHAALESVPAVRCGRASGQLRTSVRVLPANSVAARPSKRTIMDVRNHA